MEEIKLEEFSILHRKISEALIFKLFKIPNDDVKRHMQRGFYMRFSMMKSAVNTLYSEVGRSNEPIPNYLAIELSLLLNAYYLNLTGSLDNVAWALTYYHNLISSIDEQDFKQQRFVQLTGNAFIEELRKKNLQKLADELLTMNSWYKSVKIFRNPAAHNIPLFVPPRFFGEDDLREFNNLHNNAAELLENDKYDEGMNLIYESDNIGTHFPVFITEFPKKEIYELPKKINEDHENWLKMIEIVFEFGFGVKCV